MVLGRCGSAWVVCDAWVVVNVDTKEDSTSGSLVPDFMVGAIMASMALLATMAT